MKLRLDPFTLLLLGAIALASFLPVRGQAADVLSVVGTVAVGLLFFLHGAALSRQQIVDGPIGHDLDSLNTFQNVGNGGHDFVLRFQAFVFCGDQPKSARGPLFRNKRSTRAATAGSVSRGGAMCAFTRASITRLP